MASREELSSFLQSVEKRAFKHALYAVRDQEASLDIVQDAMLRLAEKYGDRPAAEFPMLFHRILQNAIRDFFRRQKVRSTWTTLLSTLLQGRSADDDQDPFEILRIEPDHAPADTPATRLERIQVIEIIEEEVGRLPTRQRQAFLLRYWEEFDVADTAKAMGCSEGSVKTHCSRATHALATALKARGVTL